MGKLEKYSSYKDSGINWVGNLPSHWKLVRIKHLFEISKKYSKDKKPNVLSLTQKGIVERDISNNEGQLAQSYVGYNIIEKDDIVFNPMDLIAGYVAKSKYNGVISHAYTTLKSLKKIDLNFYEHYFQNWYHQGVLFHLGKGVSTDNRWTLNNNSLMNLVIPIVPIDESNKIVNYINAKTAQIDEVISQKQKLIELLKEQKQIVINDAVTKGLDKNVEFVDSGVEWIGNIPKHWEVVRSKRLFQQRKERARKNERQLTASQKYGVIYQDEYMELEGRKVTQVEYNHEILKRVEANDFLISMRSFQGGIEYCKYSGSVSSAYVALIPIKHVVSEYFKYLFKSQKYITALSSTSNLVRDGQALRFENFSLVDLLIIPNDEQRQIATYIENQTTKIDKAIEIQQNYIQKLKEYKSTLIDSVVTGKVRVV